VRPEDAAIWFFSNVRNKKAGLQSLFCSLCKELKQEERNAAESQWVSI
jgi:hypothetical protein